MLIMDLMNGAGAMRLRSHMNRRVFFAALIGVPLVCHVKQEGNVPIDLSRIKLDHTGNWVVIIPFHPAKPSRYDATPE